MGKRRSKKGGSSQGNTQDPPSVTVPGAPAEPAAAAAVLASPGKVIPLSAESSDKGKLHLNVSNAITTP